MGIAGTALLISVLAGVGILVVIAFFQIQIFKRFSDLNRGINEITGKLPSRELLNSSAGLNQSLIQSLDAHRSMTGKIPDIIARTLAGEVERGLGPASAELKSLTESISESIESYTHTLSESQNQLTGAIMTLNRDGSLAEWVDSFRDVSEPIQKAVASLDRHYQTTGRILESLGNLLADWADQKNAVERAFTRFSEAVEAWMVDETTHFRNVEHRIMNRLEEVAATNETAVQSLSALQTAHAKMAGAQDNLSDSLSEVIRKIPEIIDMAGKTQEQHRDLIRVQSELQTALGDLRDKTLERSDDFEQRTKRLAVDMAKTFETIEKRHESMFESIERLIRDNETLTRESRDAMRDMPSKRIQVVTAALIGACLGFAGIIAYGVLFR